MKQTAAASTHRTARRGGRGDAPGGFFLRGGHAVKPRPHFREYVSKFLKKRNFCPILGNIVNI